MSPNASYRTTARWRSASAGLGAERGDLLAQPVHVLGQRVDAEPRRTAAWRRSATTASAAAARATRRATTSRIHTLSEPNRAAAAAVEH